MLNVEVYSFNQKLSITILVYKQRQQYSCHYILTYHTEWLPLGIFNPVKAFLTKYRISSTKFRRQILLR